MGTAKREETKKVKYGNAEEKIGKGNNLIK